MSFLNWFSDGFRQASSHAGLPVQPIQPAPASREHTRKLERHARRERLYIAIREAMTRAGILSASYKFKVLSLNRHDSEFLVMVDLSRLKNHRPLKTAEMETLIAHNAKARFDISVSAVYWRFNEEAGPAKPAPYIPAAHAATEPGPTPTTLVQETMVAADEMAALEHALRVGSSARSASAAAEQTSKNRKPGDSRLLPGGRSENAELSEAASSRTLSLTQYGDLN